jgi:hypothetical protein
MIINFLSLIQSSLLRESCEIKRTRLRTICAVIVVEFVVSAIFGLSFMYNHNVVEIKETSVCTLSDKNNSDDKFGLRSFVPHLEPFWWWTAADSNSESRWYSLWHPAGFFLLGWCLIFTWKTKLIFLIMLNFPFDDDRERRWNSFWVKILCRRCRNNFLDFRLLS